MADSLYLLSFIAGILTIFTPCIIPLIPVIFVSILNKYSKYHMLLMFLGLTISFTLISSVLSLASFAFPFREYMRFIAALVIFLMGLLMVDDSLESSLLSSARRLMLALHLNIASNAASAGSAGSAYGGSGAGSKSISAFLVGGSFGLLWSVCAGPVLVSIVALLAIKTSFANGIANLLIYSAGVSVSMAAMSLAFKHGIDKKYNINAARLSKKFRVFTGYILIFSSFMFLLGVDKLILKTILPYFPALI